MRLYQLSVSVLVVLIYTYGCAVYASDSGGRGDRGVLVPLQPQNPPQGPVISLPPHFAYATRLLHLYNAQADNPNFRIPLIHEVMSDSKRGMQEWLTTIPDVSLFSDEGGYPIYRSSGYIQGAIAEAGNREGSVFILFLPSSQGSLIEVQIQERLQRFIHYQCRADGFPVPRMGKVQRSDYNIAAGISGPAQWFMPFCIGILSALTSVVLISLLIVRYRNQRNQQ